MRRPGVLAIAIVATLAFAATAMAKQPYPLNYKTFDLQHSGTPSGVTYTTEGLQLTAPTTPAWYDDSFSSVAVLGNSVDGSGWYDSGTWTSDDYSLSFPASQLVSSWTSDTPPGTWIQSEVLPKFEDGHWSSKWYILGQWSYSDSDFHRTSVGGQGTKDGFVAIDTFIAGKYGIVAYKLQLTLYRRQGSSATPTVSRFSAIASDLRNQKNTFPSRTTGVVTDLAVPQFSQELHRGHYPEFDNGGEAWCSPTSTAMIVRYWGAAYAPDGLETAWVNPPNDPEVDFTARYVYDYHYQGAGNWPFNTAYASERGLVGDVTQLHNLAEAEPFIQAGVPLIASVAWNSNKISAADIKSTNGHLLVIRGFDANGNVIVNDPATFNTNDNVRHVYDREEFERAWIPASGGIVYVIRPPSMNLDSLLLANNS